MTQTICPTCGQPHKTMGMGLTPKQRELFLFIGKYWLANRVMPSFDEMVAGVGIKSKSGVHRIICALEERGFIRRMPNRARAIEILRAS